METIERLKKLSEKYLKDKEESVNPEGFCPNCWGRSEYGGKFYATLNNKPTNLGWIQSYYENNLKKIELIEDSDEWICRKCKTSYKAKEVN